MSVTPLSPSANQAVHSGGRCLPSGRVLSLLGGLALVAAYHMPWFRTQGIILTGAFLAQFLGGTSDLRRFLPGSSGDPAEARLLLGLVYLFPGFGALGTLLALVGAFWSGRRSLLNLALTLVGLVPLLALAIGISQLPPGAGLEVGLWLIGVGAVTTIAGALLDTLLSHSQPASAPPL